MNHQVHAAEAAPVLLCQKGDTKAREQLFRQYIYDLRRFLRRRCDFDSDDLVQDTLVASLEACSSFRGQSQFSTFICGIAINQLKSDRRRRTREKLIFVAEIDDESGILAESAGEASTLDLARAMRSLDEDLRAVLALRFWHDLDRHEIAAELSIPVGTVASRLRRAKEKLLEQFNRAPVVAD